MVARVFPGGRARNAMGTVGVWEYQINNLINNFGKRLVPTEINNGLKEIRKSKLMLTWKPVFLF